MAGIVDAANCWPVGSQVNHRKRSGGNLNALKQIKMQTKKVSEDELDHIAVRHNGDPLPGMACGQSLDGVYGARLRLPKGLATWKGNTAGAALDGVPERLAPQPAEQLTFPLAEAHLPDILKRLDNQARGEGCHRLSCLNSALQRTGVDGGQAHCCQALAKCLRLESAMRVEVHAGSPAGESARAHPVIFRVPNEKKLSHDRIPPAAVFQMIAYR